MFGGITYTRFGSSLRPSVISATGKLVVRASSSASTLLCDGSRCCTNTNAMPVSCANASSNFENASSPPALAPMPTTGNRFDGMGLARVGSARVGLTRASLTRAGFWVAAARIGFAFLRTSVLLTFAITTGHTAAIAGSVVVIQNLRCDASHRLEPTPKNVKATQSSLNSGAYSRSPLTKPAKHSRRCESSESGAAPD